MGEMIDEVRAQPSFSSIRTVSYAEAKEATPRPSPSRDPPTTAPKRAPSEPLATTAPFPTTPHPGPPPPPPTEAGRGAAKEPTLPTILVQDEEPAAGTSVERSRSPFGQRKERLPRRQAKSASPARMNRNDSFKGIQSILPAASADDLNLGDLTSDKVTFSTRGSLMFGGKKMQELIASKGDDKAGTTTPIPGEAAREYPKDEVQQDAPQTAASKVDTAQNGVPPRAGLKSGRRQPSMKMLQAAIQGGRVLSAEEMTLSMNVRSMYAHGNENATEWINGIQPMDGLVSGKTTPATTMRDTPTPDAMNADLSVSKIRGPASKRSSRTSQVADPRSSYYSKEATELAGGIEDWQDVEGQYVDRYGFIHPDRIATRSSGSPSREPGRGMQRIATSLRVESDQPRKDRKMGRGASSTRSARSVPPKDSKEWTLKKKGPGSIHSTYTQTSSRSPNPFRSRTKRVLADASDMLTLPPGLADIDEDADAGKTASSLKQREWAREEKWQKMARMVRRKGEGKGGGMHFDFDTTDSKLIERTWKGIPDRWRATAWHCFLSASAKKRKIGVTDEELIGQFHKLQAMSSADDLQIDVDVPRTVNMHIMFRRRYRGGQRLLFRVLHAVSLYFPDTGYVQGMASLAATLLCYFDEENAFVMMVRLWQLRGLEELFQNGFEGLMTCLSEFETQWLRGGDVANKLNELGITSTAYGTRWYLTLFNMSIPFPAQLRVWDVFMLLGDAPTNNAGSFAGADLDVLHATSAALIDATREILLDSDFENAMKVLTSFVPIKDEDLLMRVARAEWKIKKKMDK
ncbi:hypothetical protein M409DRAFT_62223 [Zasmidium cellare ATCC 36951]|uniref:Rab-GAP TBC domain-containing protein n=1 Tax=Zasmidium cellare ATCC 36951 TaxID=1080233 RepID=A0A6A6D7B4_ZASCE|nr:uncharacterized protein M409DRAFT_62223 [Zasmidium cellare ATCC 36951]KAF2174059.1 hypothetical protein M409DRAFT_62223 [Zasmidium cellare ATCC 36951]